MSAVRSSCVAPDELRRASIFVLYESMRFWRAVDASVDTVPESEVAMDVLLRAPSHRRDVEDVAPEAA